MIDKIIKWIFLSSGVRFSKKQVWMVLILILSILLLITVLIINGFNGLEETPDPNDFVPNYEKVSM